MLVLHLALVPCVLAHLDSDNVQVGDIRGNKAHVDALLNNTADDIVMLITADTQLRWNCDPINVACSKFRQSANKSCQKEGSLCTYFDSEITNTLQRVVMADMMKKMKYKPHGLSINGDLTAFGHDHELGPFQIHWMNFPAELYLGLGNHDYGNNVDDCFQNHCVSRMLGWFRNYVKGRTYNIAFDMSHNSFISPETATYESGSYSYWNSNIQSANGKNHAIYIQLNNRINYQKKFQVLLKTYDVRNSVAFFRYTLRYISTSEYRNHPVFINLHDLDGETQNIILLALNESLTSNNRVPIFVSYGHIHDEHRVDYYCSNYRIPFIFAGSVPANRFTVIKIKSDKQRTSEIFLIKIDMDTKTKQFYAEIVEKQTPDFAPCP